MLDDAAFGEERPFDLTAYLVNMASIRAMDVFFASYGNVDLNNVSRTLIHFDKGSLGMAVPQFYLDSDRFGAQLAAYEHYMLKVVQMIAADAGVHRTRAAIRRDVRDMVRFEQALARITLESQQGGHNFSATMKARRLSDLKRLLPAVSAEGGVKRTRTPCRPSRAPYRPS